MTRAITDVSLTYQHMCSVQYTCRLTFSPSVCRWRLRTCDMRTEDTHFRCALTHVTRFCGQRRQRYVWWPRRTIANDDSVMYGGREGPSPTTTALRMVAEKDHRQPAREYLRWDYVWWPRRTIANQRENT